MVFDSCEKITTNPLFFISGFVVCEFPPRFGARILSVVLEEYIQKTDGISKLSTFYPWIDTKMNRKV